VPGFGELSAKHIIIAEKPGACESGTCNGAPNADPTLQPLIGPSGKKLDMALGGDRGDCFLTNVRKCNVVDSDKKVKAQSIQHCVAAYLQPELDAIAVRQAAEGVKESVITAIGGDAARVVFGRGGMDSLHGTFWTRAEVESMVQEAEKVGIDFDEEEEAGEAGE